MSHPQLGNATLHLLYRLRSFSDDFQDSNLRIKFV
jgi:hypothetical protein